MGTLSAEQIEAFAIRAALGNNGGTWEEHYTEEQKKYWRLFVKDIALALNATARNQHKSSV